MKRFFNDFTKGVAYTTGTIIFLINYGDDINTYLVNNNIISYTEEGIVIPFLANLYWFFFTGAVLIFAVYGWLLYKGFADELNAEPGLLLIWLGGNLTILTLLAEPTNWFGIAFCILLLYFMIWILIRYIVLSLRTYS